jgi:hypothetical protein
LHTAIQEIRARLGNKHQTCIDLNVILNKSHACVRAMVMVNAGERCSCNGKPTSNSGYNEAIAAVRSGQQITACSVT